MKEIEKAFDYYREGADYMVSPVIDKIELMNKTKRYGMVDLSADYKADFEARTAELLSNEADFTTAYIEEQYRIIKKEIDEEYKEKFNGLVNEYQTLKNEVNKTVTDYIKAYELEKHVTSEDILVQQNKLKSELNRVNLNGLNAASEIMSHLERNVELAEVNKAHGHTISALMYMYDEAIEQLGQSLNEGFKSKYIALRGRLFEAIHPDRYKADLIVKEDLEKRYQGGIPDVSMKLREAGTERQINEYLTRLKQRRSRAV